MLRNHIEHVFPIVININIWTVFNCQHLPISNRKQWEKGQENFLIYFTFFFENIVFFSISATWRSYEKFYQVSIFISWSDVLCILKVLRISVDFSSFFFEKKFEEGRKLFLKNWRHTTEIPKKVSWRRVTWTRRNFFPP